MSSLVHFFKVMYCSVPFKSVSLLMEVPVVENSGFTVTVLAVMSTISVSRKSNQRKALPFKLKPCDLKPRPLTSSSTCLTDDAGRVHRVKPMTFTFKNCFNSHLHRSKYKKYENYWMFHFFLHNAALKLMLKFAG